MGRASLTPTPFCEGYDLSIHHRSLEEQGLDRVPQMHLGVHALAIEERGLETERGDRFQEIEELNKAYELERNQQFEYERLNTSTKEPTTTVTTLTTKL